MNDARPLPRGLRWLLVFCCVAPFGCSAGGRPAEHAADQVNLKLVDREGYDQQLDEQRGKIVLVDFWARWCEPCVANLPHVIELGRQNRDRGLAVLTVNMDSPEEMEATLNLLTMRQAGIATNLVSVFGSSSQSMEAFDIPGGAVPCYKLYDRQGQLRRTFAVDPAARRQFTLQDLDAAVEQLLAESAPAGP